MSREQLTICETASPMMVEPIPQLPAQTLQGKTSTVTGGSRDIGAVIAFDLAKRGANVCVTYTSESSKAKCDEFGITSRQTFE